MFQRRPAMCNQKPLKFKSQTSKYINPIWNMCIPWLPPLRSHPHHIHYGATRRSGSLNFINLIFLLQGTCFVSMEPARWVTYSLPCFLPSSSHPINLSWSLPDTKEPGFRVKISPSLGGKSKNLAPEEGGWMASWVDSVDIFVHVGIRDVHLEVCMMWPEFWGNYASVWCSCWAIHPRAHAQKTGFCKAT